MKKIGIIIIIVILLLLWKYYKANATKPESDPGVLDDQILSIGSSGIEVTRLQHKLNQLLTRALNEGIPMGYTLDGYNWYEIIQPLVVDGKFGKATQTMLKSLTGKISVKASEIDNLTVSFTV